MSEVVTIHAYRASSINTNYTFLYSSDPGCDNVEVLLREMEGDVWIYDRFPLLNGDEFSSGNEKLPSIMFDYELTLVDGKVIPAKTHLIIKSHIDILWGPIGGDDE